MLGKIINSTSKYNILAPVYVCEDNNTLLFIEIYIIRIFKIAHTSPVTIRSLHCKKQFGYFKQSVGYLNCISNIPLLLN